MVAKWLQHSRSYNISEKKEASLTGFLFQQRKLLLPIHTDRCLLQLSGSYGGMCRSLIIAGPVGLDISICLKKIRIHLWNTLGKSHLNSRAENKDRLSSPKQNLGPFLGWKWTEVSKNNQSSLLGTFTFVFGDPNSFAF